MAVIAKYKFNSTLYADLIPEFNAEFTNYVVTDEATEIDGEGNVIKTRIIEHDTLLPILMRFGRVYVNGESTTDNRTDSLLEILDMNTSELTSCKSMFRYNTNLTSIICEWNTTNVTNMYDMFTNCTNLTSLNVSNFNTSNVTNMDYMFYNCNNLTSLDVSNFNTSKVTSVSYMFSNCNKLTLLDVSNWNTSEVTTMYSMFYNCTNLTSLNVSNFNTSKVGNMNRMFANCHNLTSLNVSNFNTSKVIDIGYMFSGCNNLTSLDVSNFNTSNVTNMVTMFSDCNNLTSLDVSNFNTSNVTSMSYMFNGCTNLTSLDLSNFDTSKVTNMDSIFYNTSLLKDIGMLYCSQSTINALSSNISTPSTNVWVEGGIIDDLTSYDNVTYKAYYWEKEILLNSPLLEGDKIVKKDGKIYHYHKMGMVVLDGSGGIIATETINNVIFYHMKTLPMSFSADNVPICDNFKGVTPSIGCSTTISNTIHIATNGKIFIGNITIDIIKFLQQNPTTLIYELANPYYELISEEDLSIPLTSENVTISNNSLIPTNMSVKNNGMSTVAMNTSTKYTVAFDKDTDSSITINLCGSTIDTTDNVVEITTPSELTNDEITFIGEGNVSNVRILEGSVSGDAIPRETFEGLKNSFEDGKIEGFSRSRLITGYISGATNENMNLGDYISGDNYNRIFIFDAVVGENITVTQPESTRINIASYAEYPQANTPSITCFIDAATKNVEYTVPEGSKYVCVQLWRNNDEFNGTVVGTNNDSQLIDEAINTYTIKGDKSIGKYKVEYKVTGKNKFNGEFELGSFNFSNGNGIADSNIRKSKNFIKVNGGETLALSSSNDKADIQYVFEYDKNKEFIKYTVVYGKVTLSDKTKFIKFRSQAGGTNGYAFPTENPNIQIEEGTVATEYEPYKEYTKTFYLNSPLLEGDTIEDINGVATHVKRYGKVVLDGSNDEKLEYSESYNRGVFLDLVSSSYFFSNHRITDNTWNATQRYCLKNANSYGIYSSNDFRQWLSKNPITVVYRLASPIYEPISTESILCDSYVNGHLDVDSNIPVKKVKFNGTSYIMKYLQPSTNYIVQFESDSVGKLNKDYLSNTQYPSMNVVKGLNRFNVITPNEITHTYLGLQGIGFNASNIQVVATDRDNIGYFKGIQSSFEDKVISDNLFDISILKYNTNLSLSNGVHTEVYSEQYHTTDFIPCFPHIIYTSNVSTNIHYYNDKKEYISGFANGTYSPSNAAYLRKSIPIATDLSTVYIMKGHGNPDKYAVEVSMVGKNKETRETIYLNSPLLKGDKIEMYNGKLCHYHKMGKVVLDGSEDWEVYSSGMNEGYIRFRSNLLTGKFNVGNFNPINTHFANYNGTYLQGGLEMMWLHNTNQYLNVIISDKKLIDKTSNGFKQWLQANPTTVVYELAEPYYEDITPIQNEFIITSIGESSFTIDSGAIPTDGEITYSVNVKLLNDLEESINNNTSSTDTDLSTILDDIINE